MKWWKKALIATVILIVVDAGFAVAMYQQIHSTSQPEQQEDARVEKLGGLCGQIFGFGTGMTWFAMYWMDKKRRVA